MIKLRLNGEKVMGLPLEVSPDYKPQDNEVVVDSLPQVSLEENERAYIYYRNGQIEYEIKRRD
jgi:hypothetical protein